MEHKPLTVDGVDMSAIEATANVLASLKASLRHLFPEREGLIEQLLYALVIRQHVLVYGSSGTGKSALAQSLFGAVSGLDQDDVFRAHLTVTSTDSNLFGIPNPKLMREEGKLHRDPAGTILAARFAVLNEFLDATPHLLRILLNTLNERSYENGPQVIHDLPLRTAVATTNHDPLELMEQHPALAAVLDRFPFWARVDELQELESRLRMYRMSLMQEKPDTMVSIGDLEYLSGIVTQPTDQISDDILVTFDKIVTALQKKWQQKGWRSFSNRATCQMLPLLKASALLRGGWEVLPEDIRAIGWAVCDGGSEEQYVVFEEVAEPIIQEATEALAAPADAACLQLLGILEGEIPEIPVEPTSDELIQLRRTLVDLLARVEQTRPELASTRKLKGEIMHRIQRASDRVQQKIDGKA